ncbi:MAG TPA: AAA family ATPase [Candidatus Cybelea sp.]
MSKKGDDFLRMLEQRSQTRSNGTPRQPFEEQRVVDILDLVKRGYEPPAFIVEHLVPKASLVLLTGDTGACKTSLLLHTALALATGNAVAGRFPTFSAGRPVLYVNGEMGPNELVRFTFANAAGLDLEVEALPPGRLMFAGREGLADFLFDAALKSDAAIELKSLIERLRPVVVILDTLRALFALDETKTAEVRRALDWLKNLAIEFDVAIIVGHHFRKISQVSNAPRERVSGVRDLIAAADTHVTLQSPASAAVTGILLDKTRTPYRGVRSQTAWPVESQWTDEIGDSPARSTFTAGEPKAGSAAQLGAEVDKQKGEIRALLTDGPKTLDELECGKTGNSSRKRALVEMRKEGEVIEATDRVGRASKKGRSKLFVLPGPAPEAFDYEDEDEE